MKPTTLVLLIAAIIIAPWGTASAQGNRDHDSRGQRGGESREWRDSGWRHDSGMRSDYRREAWRGRHGDRDGRMEMRGVGPNHQFFRGQRLPAEYRSTQYVVNDWRAHRLSAPPRGYYWVQSGADYVLVAVATGIILQLLLDN